MEYVEYSRIAASYVPSISKIGIIQYIGYYPFSQNGKQFYRLYPNGASVHNQSIIALADTPQEAYEKMLKSDKVIKYFGIDV